jgi:hypothetical protein
MKVQELVENIKNDNFNLAEALSAHKYLPIDVKKTVAQSIIFECAGDYFGATKIDSVQKYMAYVRHMITTHTNLEYVDDDYDIICAAEYGDGSLLDAIFDCFGRDADECEMILELMLDDYMSEMSIDYTVAKFANELGATLKKLADKIGDLDLENIIPKGLDVEKINGFLNKYIK